MQFDIELSFRSGCSQWLGAFLEPDGRALCHFTNEMIHKVSHECEAALFQTHTSEYIGFVEDLKLLENGRIVLLILAGSEGPEFVERVMVRLYDRGCMNLSAFLYSDECEYVEDDDGIEHRCGLRYFFAEGALKCQDYPEVVNQYY